MHPAFSVIFLTTLIGVGQGLFLALYTGEAYSAFHVLPAQDSHNFYGVGSIVSLAFLIGGLIASFFHLGRPERAWRSATRWRTSWLSREVIVLPAFMGAVFVYGAMHFMGWNPQLGTIGTTVVSGTLVVGAVGTVLGFGLFLCTGMIYACLKFLREWHSPLTVINYTLLGGASGFTLTAFFSAVTAPELLGFYVGWSMILTTAAFVSRAASLFRNARLKPKTTLQTAIGVRHGQIAQKAQGFMGGSFNTREFFHGKSMAFLRSIKWVFLLLVFLVPMILMTGGYSASSTALLLIAFAAQYVGLIAERWFFFAQANHPQNLYYQCIA